MVSARPDPWAVPVARRRSVPRWLSAGPLVVATSLALWRSAPTPVVIGLAVASVLAVVFRSFVGAALSHLTRLLVTAVATLILFVVVSVVLYLPGAVMGLSTRRRRRPTASYWVARSAGTAEAQRDAPRPFASPDDHERRPRALAGAAIVVVVALCAVAVALSVRADPTANHLGDAFGRNRNHRLSSLEAYRDAPWADAMKDEQDRFNEVALAPTPGVLYDVADFSGRYTNTRDGARRTLAPARCPSCPTSTVWLLGGSAAFGLGQRDDHTIASELVRVAASDGRRLEVVNLGVPGWTIHQEALGFRAKLEELPAPDLVLVYDGFNDAVATVIRSSLGGIDTTTPVLMRSEQVVEFSEGGVDPADIAPAGDLGRLSARLAKREQQSIEDAAEGIGAATLFAFQPDALASERQYRAVEQVFSLSPHLRQYLSDTLEAAVAAEPSVLDLRHVLDDGAPVFADLVHTNEAGARTVAEALYPEVLRRLGA